MRSLQVEHSILWGRNLLVTGQPPWSTPAPLSSCGIDPVDFECAAAVNMSPPELEKLLEPSQELVPSAREMLMVPSKREKLLEPSQERTLSLGSAPSMPESSSEAAGLSTSPPRLDARFRPLFRARPRKGTYPPSLAAALGMVLSGSPIGCGWAGCLIVAGQDVYSNRGTPDGDPNMHISVDFPPFDITTHPSNRSNFAHFAQSSVGNL